MLAVSSGGAVVSLSFESSAAVGPLGTLTTTPVTASANYPVSAYAWTYVSGSTGLNPQTASSATTQWNAGVMSVGEVREAFFICELTINGSVYPSGIVRVTAERTP